MKNVGIKGGATVRTFGTVSDVKVFFGCLIYAGATADPQLDWNFFIDRFYRRYIRLEDMDLAIKVMAHAKKWFSCQPSSFVDWSQIKDDSKTTLNHKQKTLDEVFSSYFSSIGESIEEAKCLASSGLGIDFSTVKLVACNISGYSEKTIPFEVYDALATDAQPLWIVSGE